MNDKILLLGGTGAMGLALENLMRGVTTRFTSPLVLNISPMGISIMWS